MLTTIGQFRISSAGNAWGGKPMCVPKPSIVSVGRAAGQTTQALITALRIRSSQHAWGNFGTPVARFNPICQKWPHMLANFIRHRPNHHRIWNLQAGARKSFHECSQESSSRQCVSGKCLQLVRRPIRQSEKYLGMWRCLCVVLGIVHAWPQAYPCD